MPLRAVWSTTDLKQIFDDLAANGGAKIDFSNITEAENFRYACYKYRKKNNVAPDFSFIVETSEDENGKAIVSILVQKTPNFKLIRESATK